MLQMFLTDDVGDTIMSQPPFEPLPGFFRFAIRFHS